MTAQTRTPRINIYRGTAPNVLTVDIRLFGDIWFYFIFRLAAGFERYNPRDFDPPKAKRKS